MNNLNTFRLNTIFLKIFAIVFLIILVWVINLFFLTQASKLGMTGHDWEYLLHYDSFEGNNLTNYDRLRSDLGNPYFLQITYYIGTLKQVFGLNPQTFKLVDIFWKSLAALSAGWLVFKLTYDKMFAFFAILLFIIFPSTAGPLTTVMSGSNFLIIPFMCFSIYYYIKSAKKPNYIILVGLFFYLSLIVGPARAYLLLPAPFAIELFRLIKKFRPFVFIRRMLIFYLIPYLTLQSSQSIATLNTWAEFSRHIQLVIRGNTYSLTMPFQMYSALFVDQTIVRDLINSAKLLLPFLNTDMAGFIVLNTIFVFMSFILSLIIKTKNNFIPLLKIMIPTIIIEGLSYLLGLLSSNFSGEVLYLDRVGYKYLTQFLKPTAFQASIGAFILVSGLVLALDWWKNQRENKILMVTTFAWIWFILSEMGLFLTSYRYEMIYSSSDKYIYVSTLGAVIFAAGILDLSIKAILKLTNFRIKLLLLVSVAFSVLLLTYKDYKFLENLFYDWNENTGGSTYWQETMYNRFLDKFGREHLRDNVYIYIDTFADRATSREFYRGSFYHPIGFRIYYDENGNVIRNNCKVVASEKDIKLLKKEYTTENGNAGFVHDTSCVSIYPKTEGRKVFYPVNNFYAYKMVNKEFVDIKDEILAELNKSKQE